MTAALCSRRILYFRTNEPTELTELTELTENLYRSGQIVFE